MRYISKQTYVESKVNRKGNKMIVFHYMLDDGMEITSLTKYKPGDRVEVWFNEQLGIPVMKLHDEDKTL